jgi:hypothetical protein
VKDDAAASSAINRAFKGISGRVDRLLFESNSYFLFVIPSTEKVHK